MDEKKKKLIADWHRRSRQSQRLNYITGNIYLRWHFILGIIVIVLSTIVSSTFFVQISSQTVNETKEIIVGSVSIIVGILSALQTFLGFQKNPKSIKPFQQNMEPSEGILSI